jgi:hypothetical protein
MDSLSSPFFACGFREMKGSMDKSHSQHLGWLKHFFCPCEVIPHLETKSPKLAKSIAKGNESKKFTRGFFSEIMKSTMAPLAIFWQWKKENEKQVFDTEHTEHFVG